MGDLSIESIMNIDYGREIYIKDNEHQLNDELLASKCNSAPLIFDIEEAYDECSSDSSYYSEFPRPKAHNKTIYIEAMPPRKKHNISEPESPLPSTIISEAEDDNLSELEKFDNRMKQLIGTWDLYQKPNKNPNNIARESNSRLIGDILNKPKVFLL